MKPVYRLLIVAAALLGAVVMSTPSLAAQLQVLLPLGRTAYQTNEFIDISVVRSDAQALPAGTLTLLLTGEDGSKLTFVFPVKAVAVEGNGARATEHYHLNGWLLRPGAYTVDVTADGAAAQGRFEVYSHERRTNFKLINWGRVQGKDQTLVGQDNVGFNLYYAHYGGHDQDANIRGGIDFMPNCIMGGGHQMDLRAENDWSDPYVLAGGNARANRGLLAVRTNPNLAGIHFYDEPGLSWMAHPVTKETVPHNLWPQDRSYRAAFGTTAPQYNEIKPGDAASEAAWRQLAKWKLGFMDAAWKHAQFGISYARPDLVSVTQSQYGFSAFTDGYYFNVARSLPIVSGHGGYDDYQLLLFNPSYTLEMARARDLAKPCWYLPTWYGNTPSDRFRLEQYLSFMTGIQGMMSPPDLEPATNAGARDGITESNKLMGRLGTIFTTMAPTRPTVAMLYSLSHLVNEQIKNPRKVYYAHDIPHGQNLPYTYLAGKLIQQPFQVVVDEDIVDGTLAAYHKAVVLTSINYLDPEVITGLERFIAKGGLVLLTPDCTVQIKGATKLAAGMDTAMVEKWNQLLKENKKDEYGKSYTTANLYRVAMPLAKAIKSELDKAGVKPVLVSDNPYIIAQRQAAGDVEYLFAVNAACDDAGMITITPATATLSLPNDTRPVYDAVRGGLVAEFNGADKNLTGKFDFGPGQLRVFARTARPIGGVQVQAPVLTRDYTLPQAPIRVSLNATLLDTQNKILAGSVPMQIRIIDPLGMPRYDLYRATTQGIVTLTVPLAANDPAGAWRVTVKELLTNTEGTATFDFVPASECGMLAGASERAVYFGNDRENIFRFFKVHHDVVIVKGTSAYNNAAAARIAESLAPWGVRCQIVNAADVNRPEPELLGERNIPVPPRGYDVPGPAILLGTPADNPLIKAIADMKALPYTPKVDDFPGRGRGMLAWQLDAVRKGYESITLIAFDEAGMNEAVGSMYEALAGMNPLTPYAMPADNAITAAATRTAPAEAAIVWQAILPDAAIMLQAGDNGVDVLTKDGTLTKLDLTGKVLSRAMTPGTPGQPTVKVELPDAIKKALPAGKLVKRAATAGDLTAVGFFGGTVQIYGADGTLKTAQLLPQDITGIVPANNLFIVGLADGSVVALQVK